VRKITGKSDKVEQLIRNYKNERYPNIVITVDLLTTGIDVLKICHIVFLRRVKSRILYEQMIGRATRRCDEIGKTVFKIYDPVDIYAALQDVSTMKPLVRDPNITLEQLVDELSNPEVLGSSTSHADDVLAELSQKVMRIMRKATKIAENKPALQQKLDELEGLWGVAPAKLHQHLHDMGPKQAVNFIQRIGSLINHVNEIKLILGSERLPLIYEGADEFIERTQGFGINKKPADYLLSFNEFIKNNINQSAALAVVVNKPKDLTREQLKEINARHQRLHRNQTQSRMAQQH
jgi:type I restriction enzyme R subunit